MDKSKMAKADTTVNYNMFAGDDGRSKMSRCLQDHCKCGRECYCLPDCGSVSNDPLDIDDN